MINLRRIFLLAGAITALLMSCLPAAADDTELFTAPRSLSTSRPNVLIILDSSANWSTGFASTKKFDAEMAALNAIVKGLSDEVNLGLMLFAESGGGSTPSGAYVRYALRQMTSTNKQAFQNLMNSLDINSDKGANAPYGKAMFEAFKYYGGGTSSPTQLDAFRAHRVRGVRPGKARLCRQHREKPPYRESARQRFRFVDQRFLRQSHIGRLRKELRDFHQQRQAGHGWRQRQSRCLEAALERGGQHRHYPAGQHRSPGDAGGRIRALPLPQTSRCPQHNIITYTVAVYKTMNTQTEEQIDVMKSMANEGRGRYFAATEATELSLALQTIFKEIQAVNSVFASVTLPVSMNVRGTNLNQVYMGVFRPDANSLPRWPGNLKQYKLEVDPFTKALFLADRNRLRVENPSTGLVVDDAVSYWTSDSTFWAFQHSDKPLLASDRPDGALVEKGGLAQSLRAAYAGRAQHIHVRRRRRMRRGHRALEPEGTHLVPSKQLGDHGG